jgi:hypothetical protein
MTAISKFVRAVEDACETALVNVGFQRLRRGCIVYEIDPDFLGWVGLNRGVHTGFVRINPFVGIHCISVMKLCAEIEGGAYKKGAIATFAVHLGKLRPKVDVFEFHGEGDIAPESRRLAETVVDGGLPFMRAHASYEAILPVLEERVPTLGGYPERVAATLYRMGQVARARDFVIERRAEYEHQSAQVKESFDRFAIPFLKLVETGAGSVADTR